jgi:hypothetical protein
MSYGFLFSIFIIISCTVCCVFNLCYNIIKNNRTHAMKIHRLNKEQQQEYVIIDVNNPISIINS